jgi:hypothetical protein
VERKEAGGNDASGVVIPELGHGGAPSILFIAGYSGWHECY